MNENELSAQLRSVAATVDPQPDLAEVEMGAGRSRSRRRVATGVVAAMLVAAAGGVGFGIGRSVADGLGMGVGFAVALFCLGSVREILGSGSLFGHMLFHQQFQPGVIMILPSGGFFTLAAWILLFNRVGRTREEVSP